MKTTEERDAIREGNRRRGNCSKCGGACELRTGLNDDTHFPSITYKQCTACGWEVATRGAAPLACVGGQALGKVSEIAPGQLCRDRSRETFKVAIVLGPSPKGSKLRVCRWVPSYEPSGGRWSAPCALFEHQLEPITPDFDLTSRRGLIVSAAKRSIINGLVRWQIGPRHSGDKLTEVHDVGTVRP